MVYNVFEKKASGSGIKNEDMSDHKWVEELHKPIIKKMKKKIQSIFIDNNWGVDLADMQLLSRFSKGICFLLCFIDIFSKYAWVIHL